MDFLYPSTEHDESVQIILDRIKETFDIYNLTYVKTKSFAYDSIHRFTYKLIETNTDNGYVKIFMETKFGFEFSSTNLYIDDILIECRNPLKMELWRYLCDEYDKGEEDKKKEKSNNLKDLANRIKGGK